MVKRHSVEIMAQILGLCSKPQNKTCIIYKVNVSWKMLQHYLSELQSRGLLEVHDKSNRYVTTERGLEFVEKWRKLEEYLKKR